MRTGLWILILLLNISIHCCADWSQWRGPFFNGSTDETGLPDALDPNTVLWKSPLPGPGEATPVIVDGRVYLSGYEKEAKTLFALCIDAQTGTILWKNTAATFDKLPGRNVIASPSPAADATGAVFMYSNGKMVKYDPNGVECWRRDIVAEYGPMTMDWSYSSSPLLFQNRIYVIVLRQLKLPKNSDYSGSMASYLLILDPAIGKTLFKVDRPTDAVGDYTDAYNSPIPIQVRGKPQILLHGGNYLTGHDPVTGAEQWRYLYKKSQQRWGNTAGTPIADANRVYCVYLNGTSAFACDLDKLSNNEPPCVWTYDKPISYVPSPAWGDGVLYYIEEKSKTMICLDAETGRERWVGQLDKSDLYYASITAADGKLYVVNRKGVVTVVAANPKKFHILNTSTFDEPTVDSTISISDGKIYLRTAENLYCFGRKN